MTSSDPSPAGLMSCSRLPRCLSVGAVQLLLAASVTHAQVPTRDHYTPSVGLVGGATLLTLSSNGAERYKQEPGWSAGAWFNLPLGFGLSLEPQLQYLSTPSRAQSATGRARTRVLLDSATLGFISAPLLLKVHVGRFAAVSLGGQFDYALRVGDTPNYWTTDSVSSLNLSATGGVEIMPHSRVSVYGRYNLGFTDQNRTNTAASASRIRLQGVQAGVKVKLFGRRVYADTDGDGLLDQVDKCPTQVGLSAQQGCPIADADRDGILDGDDACPNTAGVAAHRGCTPPPVLDRDQDGVPDATDGCPATAGTRALDGCPDTDNDGIEDALDKCPTVAGGALPRGCPRLETYRASAVTFEGVSTRLTAAGRSELNLVVDYLRTYSRVTAELVGHTDDRGDLNANIGLSVRRAEAARDYIVARGISIERLSVRGEGGRRPTTSSSTVEGRLRNRRIELILR